MENRQVLRTTKRLQVRFGIDQLEHMAYTEDLSPEGFFIQTAKALKPGTRLRVQLTTRAGDLILIEGQVRWAKKVHPQLARKIKAGMGVMIIRFLEGEEFFRASLPDEWPVQ